MVIYRGPFVLGHPDEVLFNCTMMQKDMNLAIELGQEMDVPLPTTATTNEYLSAARGMGLGDYDFSIIFDVLARMTGIDTGR
jgi:3-hydroxyisobutyrate dehydrogenase-like beta-hydroxyacid dehydrogenase